jgi:acyl carrier protein
MTPMLDARRLVATALGRPLETVEQTAMIGGLPGWDSLGHMSVVLALEAQIGRQLRPDEIGRMRCVADIAAILSP